MTVIANFSRMPVFSMIISCGLFVTPLFSMESNDQEDSRINTLCDASFKAHVVEVVCGDTIKIQRVGAPFDSVEEIRLDGIRAPKMDTCLGLSAHKFLENIILDKNIIIKDCINYCGDGEDNNKVRAKIYIDEVCINSINSQLLSNGKVWSDSRVYQNEGILDQEGRASLDRTGRRTSFRVEYPKNPVARVSSRERLLNEDSYKHLL